MGSSLNLKTEDVVVVEKEIKAPWTFETLLPYLAKKYGQDEKLARAIIKCESGTKPDSINRNYTKGGTVWSSDHGYFQINDYWNKKTAIQRGFDIHLWEENLEYGFILLKERGTNPWLPSKRCWSKMIES